MFTFLFHSGPGSPDRVLEDATQHGRPDRVPDRHAGLATGSLGHHHGVPRVPQPEPRPGRHRQQSGEQSQEPHP